MNNIYAKTIHKKYSTLYELHPITSAIGGLKERWKLFQRGPGRSPGSFRFKARSTLGVHSSV